MDGKTWCESCDELHTLDKELQVERIFKCVGPIWGQREAAEKVNKYMTENNMHDQNWQWFGSWWSEGGTSYAVFWRQKS